MIKMKAEIIGAGYIGSVLAVHLKKLNYDVFIANSRGPESLQEVGRFTGATPVNVKQILVVDVDILIITIPLKNVPLLPKEPFTTLSPRTIIIDTCNYHPDRDGRIQELDDINTKVGKSTWVSKVIQKPVIKVFNNIMHASLATGGLLNGSKKRIALPISGDEVEKKKSVINLLGLMGFDGVDAGPLSESWRQQPGTHCYCLNPTKSQLFNLLEKADRLESIK